jgi:hypothetical protein
VPRDRDRERDRDRRHRTRDRDRERDRGDPSMPLTVPSPLALPSPAAISSSKRKPSAPGTSTNLGGSAVALAPQSRRASAMAGPGVSTGIVTGTPTGNGSAVGGTHPYAAVGAGAPMRGASPGQGRYGYFGESGGRRVVPDSPRMATGNGGPAVMGMGVEATRGMGVQDGEGEEERDERRSFWGVLCCR